MEKKIQALQDEVGRITKHVPIHTRHEAPATAASDMAYQDSQHSTEERLQAESPWNIHLNAKSSAGAVPGSYITQTSTPKPSVTQQDLISKGIISADSAMRYFEKYHECTVTFESTREASPLLIAAVCTIGALHSPSREDDFSTCRSEFIALSEKVALTQTSNVADVRALCIGTFWLPDLSWSLAAAAGRIATELQLHKSFYKAVHGDQEHYLRARLYYHVYVCDHHASIPFGRPPMTRECEAIREARKFLDCDYAIEDDARLVSQVCRWSVLSNIYDTFGIDVDRPLSDNEVSSLRRLNFALDSLRAEWIDRFAPNDHVGNYPRKGVSLQYHFAKLYLCSHAFRGAGSQVFPLRSQEATIELDEVANSAVVSALSILRSVLADVEIHSFLDGLPTYFHVMITFAVVFLLKVSFKPSSYIRLGVQEVKHLVEDTGSILKRITSTMHSRHLFVSIAKGIGNLLQQFSQNEEQSHLIANTAISETDAQVPETDVWNGDFAFDPYFLGDYDFYTDQFTDIGLSFLLDNVGLPG
ncbi:conserved hypothetical protein [Talaromyces stipitatus ATCC 10500]|uniref:Xylanolytic transcriptional activator regulatory domain-containing protein n=1 Tax=Talaromyces stipitatus (strain ATCC 10500 / CBS 375.48 / QM 6759 / NRRL 1006) TaxID=441959 RepID=B8M8C4_TALSN|nr:uncharacterized protein TSTA_036610 [Talaromyces stipitatus ATCC 10500]EED20437.1 conserved hypothetical protein [Talaromyces stipitatus ATCC 10500]